MSHQSTGAVYPDHFSQVHKITKFPLSFLIFLLLTSLFLSNSEFSILIPTREGPGYATAIHKLTEPLQLFWLSCRRSRRILYCFSFFFFLLLSSSSSFCQHRYFSYSLHGMTMWLRYIHKLDDRYKTYGSRNSPAVIWRHRGQKG